jgi:glycosyltransferase involved in cell wall biosynthesis
MRIGMIAPISHPYPPPGYGPWERVTHDLTEQLVARGQDVTLYAAADSKTHARLFPTVDRSLETLPAEQRQDVEDRHIAAALDHARKQDFDVIHSHLHIHVLRHVGQDPLPVLTTLHGSAWNTDHHQVLRQHAWRPYVSLSNRERDYLPELNYVATIGNGIHVEAFPPGDGDGGYLAFVGRVAPEKAPHLAIETARRSGLPLLMAGVIEDAHLEYAKQILREAGPGVDILGALNRGDTAMLLRGAAGLVMPLLWDEPFGLVVVESLSSGTPVIAWRRGSMPEIIDDGETGFLVDDVDQAVSAVTRIRSISRAACARAARERFSDVVMAAAYEEVYRQVSGHRVQDVVERGDGDLDGVVGIAERGDQIPRVNQAPA